MTKAGEDDTDPAEHALQHGLGAYFGAVALAMVVATVIGVWFKPPGAPVRLPDPDALVAGGCGVPVSEDEPTDYIGAGCDTTEATVLVLEVVAPVDVGDPECPYGTDRLVEVWSPPLTETGEPDADRDADGPTADTPEPEVVEIACVRNLNPPHPGDRGAGGGLLIIGDCIAPVDGVVVETACHGEDGPEPEYKVLEIVGDPQDCPEATEIELDRWPDLKPGDAGHLSVCAIAFTSEAGPD